MAYCKECGHELRRSAKFCPNCGARISAEAPKVAEEPKTKPTKIEAAKVKETDPTSRLMADLKFGVVFIVMGFLARLFLTNVATKGSTDADTIISVGNWLLVVFVIIGLLIIGFGTSDYLIAKKRR
jgi:predicted amidophosphoribosyltransferase